MKKETINKINKALVNPIFEGLSDEVKDPKNFEAIERKIVNTMLSDHKHATIKQFIKCKRCEVKRQKRARVIKEIGFKDAEQYQTWKKVMGMIISKQNFQLYEK